MAVMNVVLYPDDPLTQKAEPYDKVGPEVPQLAKSMIETMDAHDGVGLAGPQVGISKRIFVLCEPDEEPMCFVNPEILEMEGREEGEGTVPGEPSYQRGERRVPRLGKLSELSNRELSWALAMALTVEAYDLASVEYPIVCTPAPDTGPCEPCRLLI